MRSLLGRLPLPVTMIALVAALMLMPAILGFYSGNARVGRGFLYSAILAGGFAGFLALATINAQIRSRTDGMFASLAIIYLSVPAIMAVPLAEILPQMRYVDAWFEMISSFTTTGASLIDLPRRVPDAVHLWRGLAGWMGGVFFLGVAASLLAPLGLGGFELIKRTGTTADMAAAARLAAGPRLMAAIRVILPLYTALTLALTAGLVFVGLPGFDALMQAMAVLSTSGILPRETLGGVGLMAEVLLFCGMALALTRRSLPGHGNRNRPLNRDPELVTASALVAMVTWFVVARHWLGAFDRTSPVENLPAMGRAAWGAAFTSLSFLTTTGLVSESWIASRAWSGLTPPGLVLMGLALLGGGVATTAGGIKLLRIYALWRLSAAEAQHLIYPSMVVGANDYDRFLATTGARLAWLFAMVFTLTAIVVVALLLLLGMSLETALIFAVAALTNTGPLVLIATENPLYWFLLSDPQRAILAVAMILGRLEVLILLAAVMGRIARS